MSAVSTKGIRPSVYFWADGNEADVDDSTYVDSLYPILDGRRSMFWVLPQHEIHGRQWTSAALAN